MIFVLDTNVLWKIQKLIRLAKAARLHGHSIEVPALAHAERLAQVRREQTQPGKTFDPAIVEAFLLTHGLRVVPFDQAVAERCAEALAARYPDQERWHEARRARCAVRFQVVQDGTGKACPSTIDWYLQAPYLAAPYVFVTLDRGAEFDGTGAVSLDSAIELAEAA
jgi:hypothetical protein